MSKKKNNHIKKNYYIEILLIFIFFILYSFSSKIFNNIEKYLSKTFFYSNEKNYNKYYEEKFYLQYNNSKIQTDFINTIDPNYSNTFRLKNHAIVKNTTDYISISIERKNTGENLIDYYTNFFNKNINNLLTNQNYYNNKDKNIKKKKLCKFSNLKDYYSNNYSKYFNTNYYLNKIEDNSKKYNIKIDDEDPFSCYYPCNEVNITLEHYPEYSETKQIIHPFFMASTEPTNIAFLLNDFFSPPDASITLNLEAKTTIGVCSLNKEFYMDNLQNIKPDFNLFEDFEPLLLNPKEKSKEIKTNYYQLSSFVTFMYLIETEYSFIKGIYIN